MCGIAGIVSKNGGIDPAPIPAMVSGLRHRGPDDQGYMAYSRSGTKLGRHWTAASPDTEVVFLHRRLSILDLSEAGWQPMGTRDGRYYVTYNGEIYNYIELRSELEQFGHRFNSRCDTEVLLAAYSQWGVHALTRLVGMFAFAILDTVRRVLFLARDFFGIKPLYYARTSHCLAFASELKTLLEVSEISRQVNANRLFSYLRYGLSDFGSETLLANVLQLPAAHYLEIALDTDLEASPVRYWEPSRELHQALSFEQAAERVRELFLKSISLHLRSDVSVGSALSGGIDSSAVVMAMRRLEPDIDLHTFSYIAEEDELSEEKWVDIVGRAARAHVHKVRPTAQELVADFEQLSYSQDMPSGSTSLYAQYRVFRAAQQAGIKVMLDGQGADEVLAGYLYFKGARLASLVRQKRWQEASSFFLHSMRQPPASRLLLLQCADYLLPMRAQCRIRKLIGRDLMPGWLNMEWFQDNGVVPHLIRYNRSSSEVLRDNLHWELVEHLPNLLRYEDRNSMAFSIESRVPFLTPEFVSFVSTLPEEFLVARDGTQKAVFRRAMRGIVPDAVLNRTDKIGFATPENKWLSAVTEWARQQLYRQTAAQIPVFRLDVVAREWEQMQQGLKPFSSCLWRCLNVIQWTQRFQVQYR
jgi:asparagine synthase (glutamine-hydrolysing)